MDERLSTTEISKRKKAAILCVSLGPVAAAELFRHLPEETVEALTIEMARLDTIEPGEADAVRGEIIETAYAHGYIAEGGVRYARDVLERALGVDRANEILKRIAVVIESTPF